LEDNLAAGPRRPARRHHGSVARLHSVRPRHPGVRPRARLLQAHGARRMPAPRLHARLPASRPCSWNLGSCVRTPTRHACERTVAVLRQGCRAGAHEHQHRRGCGSNGLLCCARGALCSAVTLGVTAAAADRHCWPHSRGRIRAALACGTSARALNCAHLWWVGWTLRRSEGRCSYLKQSLFIFLLVYNFQFNRSFACFVRLPT
jgi:hypothetical protein